MGDGGKRIVILNDEGDELRSKGNRDARARRARRWFAARLAYASE